MKPFTLFICTLFVSLTTLAQPPKYSDLKILYADGNYEKLVKTAESYTEKDKTKKDIHPYIWLSKGLYKISQSDNDDERFKNAYKDAINFLGKGIKYDLKYNEGATLEEHMEYIEKLQSSVQEYIENEINVNQERRAIGWVIKYQKISFHKAATNYVLGACRYPGDKSTAKTLWKEADTYMNEITSIDDWTPADKRMLKIGILHTAAALNSSRQNDSAQKLLNKYTPWFESDDDWQSLYDRIINKTNE